MTAPQGARERLFTYDFVVLALAATFGFCNIAVFYGLATHLERLGVDPAWRGAVIAAEPLAAFLSRPFLSVWLTAPRALGVARLALAATGLVLPCYLLADDVPALLAVRLAHGLAFVCLVSAVTALLARTVPPRRAAEAFGVFSLSALVPYALMPPLMEWLAPRAGGEAGAYAWTALLTLPALAMLLPLGPRLGRAAFAPEERRPPSRRELIDNLRRPPVALLLGAKLLFFTASTQLFFFFKPYALTLRDVDPGLLFTVTTCSSIAVRVLAGPYYDRLPRCATAGAAIACLGACAALFTQSGGGLSFLALAALYGLLQGVALPLFNAAMFLASAPGLRGLNLNLLLFMMDAGYVIGPLAAGAALAAGGGYSTVYGVSAGLFACSAGVMALLALRERRGGMGA